MVVNLTVVRFTLVFYAMANIKCHNFRNIGIVSINKAIKPYGYVVESKKKTVPVSYMITLTDEGKEQEANV